MPTSLAETLPVASAEAPVTPILADPGGRFGRHYNTTPFMFPHGLSGHALFELPSLLALALRTPDHRDTYWSNGKVSVTDRWERSTDGRLSLNDTITGIADNNSLVILKHTEQDAVYGPLLQGFLEKAVQFSGDVMRRDIIVGEVLILISSPNRLTPYHVDAETNFLVQVTGNKTLCVFDQTDRALVPHAERERYFAGDFNGAAYREEKQKDATKYDLRAGFGVHIPVFAPHWVQNHDNISVALSVNYELRSVARMGRIYQVNRYLRRAGLDPVPPGQSAWRDRLKLAAAKGLERAGRLPREAPATSGWTPAA
jgi:hypothetical protein